MSWLSRKKFPTVDSRSCSACMRQYVLSVVLKPLLVVTLPCCRHRQGQSAVQLHRLSSLTDSLHHGPFLERLDHHRDHLVQVADDAVVGDREDRARRGRC